MCGGVGGFFVPNVLLTFTLWTLDKRADFNQFINTSASAWFKLFVSTSTNRQRTLIRRNYIYNSYRSHLFTEGEK